MPNINDMMPSKYLKKEDVGNGVLYEIVKVDEQDIGTEETGPDIRWVLIFRETDKPFILNKTNLISVSSILDSSESDDWIGKSVVLYNDPNIQYKGKVTGGIRIRGKKTQEERDSEI